MGLVAEYHAAQRDEHAARLRRALALRAMAAMGMSQREIADILGITQPAVSQKLALSHDLSSVRPEALWDAAAPILNEMASARGYQRLAVFGSVARHRARADPNIDLIVEAPEGTSSLQFLGLKHLFEQVLGREVDLVDYGGLTLVVDDDVLREAVTLQ